MPKIDYLTVIAPVKEVTLWGWAEAAVWQKHLQNEGLAPMLTKGKVELLISSVDSTYMGFRFQELSFSLRLGESEYFMAHAYNSIPLFALAERKLFQTPYYAAQITVEKSALQLNSGQGFEAKQAPNAPCLRTGEEDWQILIRLPKALRKKPKQAHFFYARLQGYTENYQAKLDSFSMNGSEEIFRLLRESRFQPEEWRIRANATHSKSKTLSESV